MPAAATDVQVTVNLRAHCGSTRYELDERTTNLSFMTKRRRRVELVLLETGRYLSHGPDEVVPSLEILIGGRVLAVERIGGGLANDDLGSG